MQQLTTINTFNQQQQPTDQKINVVLR